MHSTGKDSLGIVPQVLDKFFRATTFGCLVHPCSIHFLPQNVAVGVCGLLVVVEETANL
jgi:hypothetical protein